MSSQMRQSGTCAASVSRTAAGCSLLDRFVESGIGDVRKLAGRQEEWRLRVGDYRVLFGRNEAEQVIEVLAVRHRRDAYRA